MTTGGQDGETLFVCSTRASGAKPRFAIAGVDHTIGHVPDASIRADSTQAASDLGVSAASIQSAITTYLIGLSVGQLMLGPCSDRFGPRPVLIGGIFTYVLGTFGAAFAPNLHSLLVARLIQATGGCAGLVLGRAIARDVAGEAGAVRRIAILSSLTNLGPGLAPLVGTQLALLLGWRGMFGVLGIVSSTLLLAIVLTLPETHTDRPKVSIAGYVASWRRLISNPRFMRFSIGGAFGTTSFYAFVANAPFIFWDGFGYSDRAVGTLYLLVVSSLTFGSLIASRCSNRVRPHRMVVITAVAMVVASLIALAMPLTHTARASIYLPAIMLLTGAIGACSPFAMTEAVNADPQAIGAASGLYGCLQMVAGALTVELVGHIPASSLVATGVGLLCANVIALLAFLAPATMFSKENRARRTHEEIDAALS